MLTISSVEAFSDNYIWVLHNQTDAIAVDPGDAGPLMAFLDAHQLTLRAVLITHRHRDHIAGLPVLSHHNPALRIIGPTTLPLASEPVSDGDQVSLLGYDFQVMAIPGHTLDHLAFYTAPWLFCGDTLFGAGCGRLFDGSPLQMHTSLQRLACLPADTEVYPAHEYTLANLAFAQEIEPSNPDIKQRIVSDESKRDKGLPTLPSTMALETATNPFLRTANKNVQTAAAQHAQTNIATPLEVFTELRAWKDGFRNVIG
jgi:hydroxyacylglutathione hydrolase